MKKNLMLVTVDEKYCDYLRKFDSRVPYNFGNKKDRPFIGILLEVGECKYYAPLSSPKEKHLKLKSKIDLFKIDEGKLGVINFNNMIPVLESNVSPVKINTDDAYSKILQKQLRWLNRNSDKLYNMSKRLYCSYKNDKLPKTIVERCCNFLLLEKMCKKYNKKNMI